MLDYGEVCFAGFTSIEDHDYANSDRGKAEIMVASFVGLLWVACTGALSVGGSSCWENNQVIVIDFTTVNLNDYEMFQARQSTGRQICAPTVLIWKSWHGGWRFVKMQKEGCFLRDFTVALWEPYFWILERWVSLS